MTTISTFCCEWQRQAQEFHDTLLDALKTDNQESWNWMMAQKETQSTISVLPIETIAVIDFGDFATQHQDEISFEAKVSAITISRYSRPTVACSAPTTTLTMRAS